MTDRLGTAATGYPYGTDKGGAAGNDQPDFATYTKDGTTGFEYAMNRYYSAGLGRFLTVDPASGGASPRNPERWNKFAFGEGDPVNRFDPSGNEDCTPSPGVDFCAVRTAKPDSGPDESSNPEYAVYEPDGELWFPWYGDFSNPAQQWLPSATGYLFEPDLQIDAVTSALSAALYALTLKDCASLFETAESRQGAWNPVDVLKTLIDHGTNNPAASDGFTVSAAMAPMFTYPGLETPITKYGVFGGPVIGAAVLFSGPLFAADRATYGSVGVAINAAYMLHELGHVYFDGSAFGSDGSRIVPDAINPKQSEDYSSMALKHCF